MEIDPRRASMCQSGRGHRASCVFCLLSLWPRGSVLNLLICFIFFVVEPCYKGFKAFSSLEPGKRLLSKKVWIDLDKLGIGIDIGRYRYRYRLVFLV